MAKKLYCYVDESGQDTKGKFFVVTTVVIGSIERESVRAFLGQIEKVSGKGRKKWSKATKKQRLAYMERVVRMKELRGKLFFAHFEEVSDYLPCIVHTIAQALTAVTGGQGYQVTVLIDGLRKRERHKVGVRLRRLKVVAKKVRGLRDESDEFIRLADAIAGFVRDYLEGADYVQQLYQEAVRRGIIQQI